MAAPKVTIEDLNKFAVKMSGLTLEAAREIVAKKDAEFAAVTWSQQPVKMQRDYDAKFFADTDAAAVRETIKGLCDEIERVNERAAKAEKVATAFAERVCQILEEIEQLKGKPVETKPTFPARALHFAPTHKVGP